MNENTLTWYSDEEIRRELQRRERLAKGASRPQQLDDVDISISRLRGICRRYIDEIAKEDYVDSDTEHYIMEIAVETIYGPGIWDWVNEHIA